MSADSSERETVVVEHVNEDDQPVWGLPRKIGFQFLCCYIFLFGIYFVVDFVYRALIFSFTDKIPATIFDGPWTVVVPWIGHHLFQLSPTLAYSRFDSGDSMSDYLQLVVLLSMAAGGTALWSLIDRHRLNYARASQWLRLYVQLVLAIVLFFYGFDKVIPLQFKELTPARLSVQVGDFDKFGMLWTFMASSKPYTIFSGVLEVLSGLLLLIPNLRALGALLTIIVMTNVVALNIFYDVSVKMFSAEFLLLAIFLAAPEFPRLIRMLVLNRAVEPRRQVALSDKRSVARWAYIVQGVVGISACLLELSSSTAAYARRVTTVPNFPMRGTWKVEEFKVLGNPQAPLLTGKQAKEYDVRPGEDHWTKLFFENPGFVIVEMENGKYNYVRIDTINKTQLNLHDGDDPKWTVQLAIQPLDKSSLALHGQINGVPVEAKLRPDDHTFRLTSDKYHFIR